MRIIQLTPGTGNFHCGTCLHDHAAVRALRARGHDALMVPLYLPHVLDEPEEGAEVPIFLGGISVFLDQKFPALRRRPQWIDRALGSPRLLRWCANFAGMTSPRDLGESTVSMLNGEHGCQARELDRLIDWLRTQPKPDVISLSNSLLAGMARRLKEQLGAPVVCSLQGEDSFLDGLPEPYRDQSWDLLARCCGDIDHFVSVSRYFAVLMRERLGLSADRVTVVHPGVANDPTVPAAQPPQPPVIGFLARLSPLKGLDTLVDAFVALKHRDSIPGLRLRAAGAMTTADARFVESLKARLAAQQLSGFAEFLPNLAPDAKRAFLHSLSVLSVPATYGEAFGAYVLEAMAAGVPVVQPRHAAFPEIIEETGGGLLCEPDDVRSLADTLERLLAEPDRARQLGEAGRKAVREGFSIDGMAGRLEAVFASVAPGRT